MLKSHLARKDSRGWGWVITCTPLESSWPMKCVSEQVPTPSEDWAVTCPFHQTLSNVRCENRPMEEVVRGKRIVLNAERSPAKIKWKAISTLTPPNQKKILIYSIESTAVSPATSHHTDTTGKYKSQGRQGGLLPSNLQGHTKLTSCPTRDENSTCLRKTNRPRNRKYRTSHLGGLYLFCTHSSGFLRSRFRHTGTVSNLLPWP